MPGTDPSRQREIVAAFLAASRHGEFDALVALLDPGAVLRADRTAVRMGASQEAHGAAAVAGTFSGSARVTQPACPIPRFSPNDPSARTGRRGPHHLSVMSALQLSQHVPPP